VHNIAATSSHSNPPSGQRPSPNSASKQTAAVRTTPALAGASTAAWIWNASCTAPCARRCVSTAQLGSRTGLNVQSVLQRSMHAVSQQPARLILMTSQGQQVCKPLLPRRGTGMRCQDNSPSPAVRLTKPRPDANRRATRRTGLRNSWRVQSRNCRNIEPDQAQISNTNCIAVAAHRASRVSQPLRRSPNYGGPME